MVIYIQEVRNKGTSRKKGKSKMKEKILKRIEELEERNTSSRALERLLDKNNKEDRKLIKSEHQDRLYRIAVILELKMLLESEEN